MLITVLAAALFVLLAASMTAFGAALVSVDRQELDRRAAGGDRRAAAVVRALERPGRELSEGRLGIVLCTLALGAVIQPTVDAVWASTSSSVSDPSRAWSVALALVVAIGVQVVLAEMVARSIGAQRPVGTLLALARPVRLLNRLLAPPASAGEVVARRLVGWAGAAHTETLSRIGSREELRRLVQLSERSGAIRSTDAELFDRTLRFAEKTAADAFTPRVEVRSLPVDATVGDLVDLSRTTGYSRFPVHDEDLDHILGVVHVKDVLGIPPERRREQPLSVLFRPVHVVPESKDLESLMRELRAADGQFAIVVDEYGGTAGIVTLEDLIEEIVGDISDEHDPARAEPMVRRWGGAHLLSGSLHPDEVHDACGFDVPEGDYETIAGFVMERLGRVPVEGDRFQHDGWDVEAVEMEGHRLRTVKLVAPSPGVFDPAATEGSDAVAAADSAGGRTGSTRRGGRGTER